MKTITKIKHVGKPFLTFVFLMISLIQSTGQEIYKKPDFAFPQNVEKNSKNLLDSALNKGDDILALRALMNLCVARNELTGSESIQSNINLLDSISNKFHGLSLTLLKLIEGEILWREYEWHQYVYNDRILPMDLPYPSDPSEWSAYMFKAKILQLIKEATKDLEEHTETPISKLQLLLDNYDDAEKIGFSVSDFIAFNAVSVLQGFAKPNAGTVIPFYPDQWIDTVEGKASEEVKRLLNGIIENNINKNSVIAALAYLKYGSFLQDSEKEKYFETAIERLKGRDGASLLIYELWRNFPKGDAERQKELYTTICGALKEFPNGWGSTQLKYAKNILEQKEISLDLPSTWLPDTPLNFKTTLTNVYKGYILLYKLKNGQYDDYDNLILKKFSGEGNPYKVLEIEGGGEIPFEIGKEMELEGLSQGIYVAIPSIYRTLPKGWKTNNSRGIYSTIRISNIAVLTLNDRSEKEGGRIFVVDATNQEPIKGATVSIYNSSSNKSVKRFITGDDGSVKVPSGYYRIVAQYGNNFAKSEVWFNYIQNTESRSRHISLLTDLSIYRPGDTVKFAAIGWMQNTEGNSIIKNSGIEVTLRDVNFNKVDSANLILDNQGRVSGEFIVPKGRLLGGYSLSASFRDNPDLSCGMTTIEIAEYKLPPFEVKIEQEPGNDHSIIQFKGLAQTYSGLPIGNSNVRITVDFTHWEWGWIRNNTTASFHSATTTSNEGTFEVDLPTKGLQGTIFERGVYTIKAEVISLTGESVISQPLLFYLGEAHSIRPSITDKYEIKGEKINLNIPVYDMAGLPEKVKVQYKLINTEDDRKKIEGEFISPSFSIDSHLISSGKYKLEFRTGEEEWVKTETTFWRSSDKVVPYETPLWIPLNEYVYEENQKKISISFGSYWKDWILCAISNKNGLISQKWIEPSEGLTNFEVDIFNEQESYFIELSGLHNLEGEKGSIKIIPAERLNRMTIETLSFRDNVKAGTAERWSFKFNINDIATPEVNVFAVMSDKALNSLKDFKWNLGIWWPEDYSKINIGLFNRREGNSFRIFNRLLLYPHSVFEYPAWETYGYSWIYYNRSRFKGPVLYKMAATRDMNEEVEYEDSVSATMTVKTERAMGNAMIAETEEELSIANETNAGGYFNQELQGELRPIEMPLAFFKTDLKSDNEGNVNINFIVPDFNTTWQFQLAGYNENMMNASLILDALASKVVMTKSNLPQYLRTGDRAEVSALLFNNSPDTIPLKGKIEILNPENNVILAERIFSEELTEPSGNRFISLNFDVPDNLNVLAVKCYGISGLVSDGEQGFIPVYPSSTPVIDSKTFYVKTDEESIGMKLPKYKKGSNVTLKYCDNPLWEVLLALPSLNINQNGGALFTVKSLYAVLIANNIINSHPEIEEGLKKILNSEDSTLSLSNLQKDQSLKMVGLEATPWVNNASSETQRIRSLENYLSLENVSNQIQHLKDALKKLQNPDGGWSWFEGFKSSPYITSEILYVLSYLSQAQLLDNDLEKMAKSGIKYYDKYLMKLRKEKMDLSLFPMMHYIYSRSLLVNGWSGEMNLIKNETLERISKEWRYGNIGLKAVAALVMLKEKGYEKEANVIMESIKEFLNQPHPLFEEAWALILFNQEDPKGETAEKLRELLYLQKESEDWGSEAYTTGIIHALIASTPDSVFNHPVPDIYINGEKIRLAENQALTGNFTVDLDAKDVSEKILMINRVPGCPGWGGIISQNIQPIKDIKRESVEDLKITKHIYVTTPAGKNIETSDLKKGDKVQVVLNIDCKKVMNYVTIIDQRGACLQPIDQLSGIIITDGISSYREIKNNSTSFFIETLPIGKYIISYDCQVEREGEYSLGIASIQSLYSPAQTAHSSGKLIKVNP